VSHSKLEPARETSIRVRLRQPTRAYQEQNKRRPVRQHSKRMHPHHKVMVSRQPPTLIRPRLAHAQRARPLKQTGTTQRLRSEDLGWYTVARRRYQSSSSAEQRIVQRRRFGPPGKPQDEGSIPVERLEILPWRRRRFRQCKFRQACEEDWKHTDQASWHCTRNEDGD
jgi:hypothetical protein